MYTPHSSDKALSYLSEVLDTLRSTNQYEQVLHLVIDRLVRTYGCHVCAAVLIDEKTEYLNIENSFGLSWTFSKEFRRKLATGPIGELLWTGKPICIASPDSPLAEEVQLEHPFGSCIIAQLAIDHRTLGYLYAASRQVGALDHVDIPIIQGFANAAAIAIHKSRLHYENMHLDKIDHDTGLDKYEAFSEKMRTSLERADKFGERFAVIILDVDNFKTLMKTYGHETSLVFLKELGDIVKQQLRGVDIAGRYGFDEFIILLSKTSLEEALDFARSLANAVEAGTFTSYRIKSTISIGVAAFPENGRSVDKLLTATKNAVFEAQRAGRNKVFHYTSEWDSRDVTLCEHTKGEAVS